MIKVTIKLRQEKDMTWHLHITEPTVWYLIFLTEEKAREWAKKRFPDDKYEIYWLTTDSNK